ncbi:hypothetical protein [Cupriavidus consociatus]|uniref:hypothetical protein n=1 Tax=Cupriavidus consociatus TaxID=2821357 RepID=UPI001AE6878F|nr:MULTISPECIES: hypothetical protein [unclassified Cupriavidus]MBP0625245.1 hypothetical protein [Cupriavidus sp. LEh25]MDK2661980.1 hypothetical protein [Cupriavidus sp. LEh21]
MQTQIIIRKKPRLKISPEGIICLPLRARQALSMTAAAGFRVSVAVVNNSVELKPVKGEGGSRVSPKGQMDLQGDARTVLQSGAKGQISMVVSEEEHTVVIRPWTDE